MSDLVKRLQGFYSIPIEDGAGPLNGEMTFNRQFNMPPICGEAAVEITRLTRELAIAHNEAIYAAQCACDYVETLCETRDQKGAVAACKGAIGKLMREITGSTL